VVKTEDMEVSCKMEPTEAEKAEGDSCRHHALLAALL